MRVKSLVMVIAMATSTAHAGFSSTAERFVRDGHIDPNDASYSDISNYFREIIEMNAGSAAGWMPPGQLGPNISADHAAFDRFYSGFRDENHQIPPMKEGVWSAGRFYYEGGSWTAPKFRHAIQACNAAIQHAEGSVCPEQTWLQNPNTKEMTQDSMEALQWVQEDPWLGHVGCSGAWKIKLGDGTDGCPFSPLATFKSLTFVDGQEYPECDVRVYDDQPATISVTEENASDDFRRYGKAVVCDIGSFGESSMPNPGGDPPHLPYSTELDGWPDTANLTSNSFDPRTNKFTSTFTMRRKDISHEFWQLGAPAQTGEVANCEIWGRERLHWQGRICFMRTPVSGTY